MWHPRVTAEWPTPGGEACLILTVWENPYGKSVCLEEIIPSCHRAQWTRSLLNQMEVALFNAISANTHRKESTLGRGRNDRQHIWGCGGQTEFLNLCRACCVPSYWTQTREDAD